MHSRPPPSLEHHFYLKYEPAFQRGNKNHQGELHQILWIGTRLLISKVRWLQGRKPRSRDASGLICGQASEVACWVGNDHQPPAKCYRNFGEDSLAGSQLTPGGFVLSTPTVKLVEQIKCLICLGIFELVWQAGKKKCFPYSDCNERNNNTCLTGEHEYHLYINKRTHGSTPLASVLTPPWLNLYIVFKQAVPTHWYRFLEEVTFLVSLTADLRVVYHRNTTAISASLKRKKQHRWVHYWPLIALKCDISDSRSVHQACFFFFAQQLLRNTGTNIKFPLCWWSQGQAVLLSAL